MKLRIEKDANSKSARVVNAETGELLERVTNVLIDLTIHGNRAVITVVDPELKLDGIDGEVHTQRCSPTTTPAPASGPRNDLSAL